MTEASIHNSSPEILSETAGLIPAARLGEAALASSDGMGPESATATLGRMLSRDFYKSFLLSQGAAGAQV